MTPPDIHLSDYTDQATTYADGGERRVQPEGSMHRLYLPVEANESAQSAQGEPCAGVGSESCDQETRAWNPRYTSMNYALARLARAS